MTEHEISIDLLHDEATDDHAYRAFCECGDADPVWHHSDARPSSGVQAIWDAHDAAQVWADEHMAEAGGPDCDPPDIPAFLALRVPTTDPNGYAR